MYEGVTTFCTDLMKGACEVLYRCVFTGKDFHRLNDKLYPIFYNKTEYCIKFLPWSTDWDFDWTTYMENNWHEFESDTAWQGKPWDVVQ